MWRVLSLMVVFMGSSLLGFSPASRCCAGTSFSDFRGKKFEAGGLDPFGGMVAKAGDDGEDADPGAVGWCPDGLTFEASVAR